MRQFHFLLLIFLMFPAAVNAQTQTFNFTVTNNTALSFENGSYIIEIIEISKPMYIKVNVTSNGSQIIKNLYDGEDAISFSQIKLSSSSITDTSALIKIEFPQGWGFPTKYPIIRPVAPTGSPNIIVTRTVDRTNINVGDTISFTIKVENTGNATAYNVTLAERLPSGFTSSPGSRFPPVVADKIEVGESQETYYALKAVDAGTYSIEPTVVKYGTKMSKTNPLTITVGVAVQEKSNLTTVISIDKKNAAIDDSIKVSVRITNTGKVQAKSVLVDGEPPLGTVVIEGDLRQVYDSIAPGEQKEYRVVLKANDAGNYSINLRTVYNDEPIGKSSGSEPFVVTREERNYLYIILPITTLVVGIVIFTIKRHKEYSY